MRNLLRFNPELARNIWQEFNTQRLVLMPLTIGLVVMLIFTFEDNIQTSVSVTHNFSLIIFLAVTSIWGIRSASGTLLEEQQGLTWDWQRMSGLHPWKLTFGKLFGGTAYNWYGGLICILIFLITMPAGSAGTETAKILTAVFFTITVHGLAMLFTLPQMSRPYSGRSKLRGLLIYSTVAGLIIYIWIYKELDSNVIADLNWYGIHAHHSVMALITAVFYCTWTLAGVYRSMRAELQYADPPTWWITFLTTNLIFQFGFLIWMPGIPTGAKWIILMTLAMVQYLFATYAIALSDQRDIVAWRKFFNPQNSRAWFQDMPIWLISLTFALLGGIVLAILNPTLKNNIWGSTEDIFYDQPISVFMFVISLFGFVIRDLGILLLLNFSLKRDKASTYAILYFFILYGLLPAIARPLSAGMLFYPDVTIDPLLMPVFPVIEATVIGVLVFRKINGAPDDSGLLPA